MAASLVVMLPVLVVFLLFQRYFLEGISMSGTGAEVGDMSFWSGSRTVGNSEQR